MSEKIQKKLALAEQYVRAGAYDDAKKILLKVIDKARANVRAWLLLGQVYGLQNAHSDAEKSFAQAARLNPGSLDAHTYLGIACMQQGKDEQAITAFRAALDVQPRQVRALANMVTLLHKLERQGEALPYQERWLSEEPLSCSAHYSAAVLHQTLHQLPAARKHYEQVLALGASGVSVYSTHLNLGVVCHGLSDFEAAIAHSHYALASKRDCAVSYYNIGNAQKELGKHDEAVASFDQALKFDPDLFDAHSNILFCMNFSEHYDAQKIFARHAAWAERQAAHYAASRPHSNDRDPLRTLRIGFVSADFREHPVGFFLEGVLQYHSAANCEVYCYSNSNQEDAVTERMRAHVEHWRKISALDDDAVAEIIRADGIDILVDLSGHTAGNRLQVFARKPAPVQVTWLGFLASTGMTAMDYLIADPWSVPVTEETHFTEKIWRLPETMLCLTPPDVDLPIAPLPALANGYITFGCFNNLAKMNNEVVALWARVLESVPGSRIFLKAKQLKETSVRQSVTERFAVHGIAADRLILEGPEPRLKYLAAYQRVDIALDPFPYTGFTTSTEGLWMGVPLLTLAGERFLSRQGIGLLLNTGLPEWIAADAEDYVAKAASHACNPQRLANLRNSLRRQVLASPIFDAPRFTNHFEAALRGMWMKWCDQQQGMP